MFPGRMGDLNLCVNHTMATATVCIPVTVLGPCLDEVTERRAYPPGRSAGCHWEHLTSG